MRHSYTVTAEPPAALPFLRRELRRSGGSRCALVSAFVGLIINRAGVRAAWTGGPAPVPGSAARCGGLPGCRNQAVGTRLQARAGSSYVTFNPRLLLPLRRLFRYRLWF